MNASRGSEAAAGLSVLGAGVLIGSLFLTWSHQLPPAELRHFHGAVLFGVAARPTAWQVYAIAAEVLATLAIGIAAAGLWGRRPVRALVLLGVALGLAFVLHAAHTAPTNGLLLATGTGDAAHYFGDPATGGPGETVALAGLIVGGLGLLLGALSAPTRDRQRA